MMQDHAPGSRAAEQKTGADPYLRFAGMIATSTLVMFALTYANVFDIAHIHFSQERLYMAVLMGDVTYMRGMIPHHSIAILTSDRSGIQDVRVRALAANGVAATAADAAARPVPSFEAAP